MIIDKFYKRGIVNILFMLAEKESKITDIIKKVHPQTAYRALDTLMQLQLVSFERRDYNAKYYFLTPKGKRIVQKLKEMEKILQED